MIRREFLIRLCTLTGTILLPIKRVSAHAVDKQLEFTRLDKPDTEWKKLLSHNAYNILFEEGTEPAWSSPLNKEKREGTYVCAACYLPLFESSAKYNSHTGWPSFFQSIPGRVDSKRDWKLAFLRTEYHCARCAGHQGHVFDDGPRPTGKRFCNNGLALNFIPADEDLPELRN